MTMIRFVGISLHVYPSIDTTVLLYGHFSLLNRVLSSNSTWLWVNELVNLQTTPSMLGKYWCMLGCSVEV
jgi:hypothetical protein